MNDLQLKRSSVAFLGSNVMVGIEGTIIATALPAMMAELHGITLISWVIAIFMLMMAVTAPIWTKLSERFGYKKLFLIGTAIFVASSLVEGFAVNMPMLIIARATMGIGAGAMQQLPFVIYGVMFAPDKRRQAIGNAISAYAMAAVVGPLLGGLIVAALGWRWVFFINIPIGLLMMAVIIRNFHQDFSPNRKSIDYAGSSLLSLAVIALMLALQFMGNASPNWGLIALLFVVAIALALIFIAVERRATDPVIPLALFKNRPLMARNAMMFLIYGFFGFYSNYLPTWGQGMLGATALMGGLILVPSSITQAVFTPIVSRLMGRFSEKLLSMLGFGAMILGAILLVILPAHAGIIWLMLSAALFGIAFSLSNTVLQVSVQEVVPTEQIGAATALNALIRTLGTTLILSSLAVELNSNFAKAVQTNGRLTIGLINQISDAAALKNIPHALVEPLRLVMYQGLHNLALIGLGIIVVAVVINSFTKWKKAQG